MSRRRRRRSPPWWARLVSAVTPAQIVTLVVALSGGVGYGELRKAGSDARVVEARAQTRAVGQNAAQIIAVLAVAVDSLDVRVAALEERAERWRRRRPVTDTVMIYPAELYGPAPRPPGFLSRLLGRS